MSKPGSKPPPAEPNPPPRHPLVIPEAGWTALAASLGLAKRQLQIVRAVFEDTTEFAIAENLGVSQHTVHTHLERIHRRFQVHSRVELVLFLIAEFLRLTANGAAGLPPVCPRHAQGKCPLALKTKSHCE